MQKIEIYNILEHPVSYRWSLDASHMISTRENKLLKACILNFESCNLWIAFFFKRPAGVTDAE